MTVYFPQGSVQVQPQAIIDGDLRHNDRCGKRQDQDSVPLEECAGKLKMVSPEDQLILAAKQIGISFGD